MSTEINALTPAYASKLDLKVYCTDVKAQKIDSSTFKTFGMILVSFQLEDNNSRNTFFDSQ